MPIDATRAIISAILNGTLRDCSWVDDPVLGLSIPTRCPGVPDRLLAPRDTWSNGDAYDEMAAKLSRMFAKNFAQFVAEVPAAVARAGPRRS
jgi:phosphoenolpyruvate carboxykinase (ATP)